MEGVGKDQGHLVTNSAEATLFTEMGWDPEKKDVGERKYSSVSAVLDLRHVSDIPCVYMKQSYSLRRSGPKTQE